MFSFGTITRNLCWFLVQTLDYLDVYSMKMIETSLSVCKIQFDIVLYEFIVSSYTGHQSTIKTTTNFEEKKN